MALRHRYATASLLVALGPRLVTAWRPVGDTAPRSVLGAGTAQAAPDTAEMSFGATTMSPNARTALDAASEVAGQIASALKKQGMDDPAPARAGAIEEAVADARKSVEAMAAAAGKSVGGMLSMSSSDAGIAPMVDGASEATGAARDVRIEPGRLAISASAGVVFELE